MREPRQGSSDPGIWVAKEQEGECREQKMNEAFWEPEEQTVCWEGGRGKQGTWTDRRTDGRLRPYHSQEQEAQLQGYYGLFPEAKILITQEKAYG